MWLVTEQDKPCDAKNFPVHHSWGNALYNTREEAVEYIQNWLGSWSPGIEYWNENDVLIYEWDDEGSQTKFEIKEVDGSVAK